MKIFLTGSIGSGKSLVANYLTQQYNFTELFFAQPLKEFALLLGFTEQQVYGSQEDKTSINEHWGISSREFLQKFGSEVCRDALPKLIPNMNIQSSLWVDTLKHKLANYENVVVSDCRFPDEAALADECGGIIIRLVRETNTESTIATHQSETEMQKIKPHYVIYNNSTKEYLFEQIDSIVTQNMV